LGTSERCTLFQNQKCPVGSVCTAKFVADGEEKDVRYTHRVNAQMTTVGAVNEYEGITCWVDRGQIPDRFSSSPQCPTTGSESVLGTGQTLAAFCENIDTLATGYDYEAGPDQDRRISCKVTLTLKPAGSLTTIAAGDTVSIFAPGAGTLGITPGGTASGKQAAVARRAKRPFKPARRTTSEAGPVTFKLKLTKGTKRKLKKKGQIRLPIRISFTSSEGGEAISKTVRVKLTKKPKRPK